MNSTERSRKLRQKRKAQGLEEVRGIWLPLDDHKKLKSIAKELQRDTIFGVRSGEK